MKQLWIITIIIIGFCACQGSGNEQNDSTASKQTVLETPEMTDKVIVAPVSKQEQTEITAPETKQNEEKQAETKPKKTTEKEETSNPVEPTTETTPNKEIETQVPPQKTPEKPAEKRQEKKELPKVTQKPVIATKPRQKNTTKPTEKPSTKKVETPKTSKPTKKPTSAMLSHAIWDRLLRSHVSSSGKVNYSRLKQQEKTLDGYLDLLAKNPVKSSWTRNEKMVYWINAYNAFTIKLILKNYPVESIMDLHGGKAWDVKWIKLGNKTYSLNNIENDILRPQYKDARIHFAVNCAAKSCPKLHNRAWTANNLNTLFQQQTRAFINNSTFNQISANNIKVSQIFNWYKADFGNLIQYLNKYSNTKINTNAKVEFLEYDWRLNN